MKISINSIRNIKNLVRELTTIFNRLDFENNFESFEWSGTIAATTTITIPNELQVIPSRRIIVKQIGNGIIDDSTTDWSLDYVYLRNNSANSITLKVIFIK